MIRLDPKPLVDRLNHELAARVRSFKDEFKRAPQLVVAIVGNDPASALYVSRKQKAAEALGLSHQTISFPSDARPNDVRARIEQLNQDPHVDAILIQRPLPTSFRAQEVLYWVHPDKDVDAFHPENIGRISAGFDGLISCTPLGVIELLNHYHIPISGRVACVVGRSAIVGRPMAALLLNENATVIQAHSKTPDLANFTRQADLLIVAAGKPNLIRGEHIKPGAVVVDVGIHRMLDGSLVGDVEASSASQVASALTPVPGGVGPMTIAMLMLNTLKAAERRQKIDIV